MAKSTLSRTEFWKGLFPCLWPFARVRHTLWTRLTPQECEQRLRKRLSRGKIIKGWVNRPDYSVWLISHESFGTRGFYPNASGQLLPARPGTRVTVRLSPDFGCRIYCAIPLAAGLLVFFSALWTMWEQHSSSSFNVSREQRFGGILISLRALAISYAVSVLVRSLYAGQLRSLLRYLKEALDANEIRDQPPV